MNYYLYQNDEPKGPYTLGQLRSMWHAGTITGETHYCVVGSDKWKRLKLMIDELEPTAQPPQKTAPTEDLSERLMRQANAEKADKLRQRSKLVIELRENIERSGQSWLSCPRCEGPATGTRGCLGALFFPISLLIMKPTYNCHACGFKFKQ